MAHHEETAMRIRSALGLGLDITEKKMMGGLCFLLNGHMIGGADRPKDGPPRFMFRVGKENDILAQDFPGAEPMVQGGRRLSGLFFVDAESCSDAALKTWLDLAVSYASGLPPKA